MVLYFYPKDFTGGCTTQACELRDNIFAFKNADAVILGVSVDDVASHEKFAKEHSLPFDILADPKHEASEKYGVLTTYGTAQLASRQTFLIGPDGKIVKHWAKVDPEGPFGHGARGDQGPFSRRKPADIHQAPAPGSSSAGDLHRS